MKRKQQQQKRQSTYYGYWTCSKIIITTLRLKRKLQFKNKNIKQIIRDINVENDLFRKNDSKIETTTKKQSRNSTIKKIDMSIKH